MKKLLTLIVALLLLFALASCDLIPEDIMGTIEDIAGSILGGEQPGEDPPTHVHDFVSVKKQKAYCAKDGYEDFKCYCGETKQEIIPALGHDLKPFRTEPTCIKVGTEGYSCTRCSKVDSTEIPALGHEWGEFVEASRLIHCERNGCSGVTLAEGNGKYKDVLVFTFGDEAKATLEAKHNELVALLEAAEKYDETKHGYAEEGDLYDAYMVAEGLYEEYSDLIFEAQGQLYIARTLYYCDIRNEELKTIYDDMMTYYTDLVAKFYSLSQPWYDSMYRDFFFYGATEEEINAFLFDSNAIANPEYTALKDRNDAIELEFLAITNPIAGNKICELYEEMVQNNNKIAELLGYDNYLDYAYENVYDREYSPEDVATFVEYVKTYIAPAYNAIYTKWNSIYNASVPEDVREELFDVVLDSFFYDGNANSLFNDYIDEMNMAFTSNPDKQISFSDELNNLMADGNLFRGTYEGAYVTYIYDGDIPIAYFGNNGYDVATTVAHEFGHYMNEIYNRSEFNQSYDLLETHSQGQEMLFIYFVEGEISADAYQLVETYQLLNMLSTIMSAVQVDCFEQAVYLNSYTGTNSDIIMADGKITADEYDLLYASISIDLGIDEAYRQDTYWRYGMTITSPCYYISYSVSAINALQIYAKANSESFEAAKDSYLKLFTYTDVDPDMDMNEVLEYAGLLSYTDEEAYKKISFIFD